MPSLHRGLVAVFLLLAILATISSTLPIEDSDDDDFIADAAAFQQLLDNLSDESLHAALHNYSPSKYKHGVFLEDRTAMSAVRRDNAAVATALVKMMKRQASANSSSPAPPPPST